MNRAAIIADGRAYSYEELDEASKRVAGRLLGDNDDLAQREGHPLAQLVLAVHGVGVEPRRDRDRGDVLAVAIGGVATPSMRPLMRARMR